ncbi:MAG: YihY/virulence factor BrkB family protein [Actinobacteria bacterium]|nr:YihY/virulence factor BrkB family protein [Actinomycetota bacterium]
MANRILCRAAAIGSGLWAGTKDLASGIYRHDCVGLAAQIAYSFLFSLFPFLLFLRALVAYFPGAATIGDRLLQGLADLVSTNSRLYQIVESSIFKEIDATSTTLLSIGIVLTLWSASGAIMTLTKAVNRAYGLDETRSWQRRRLMAGGLAVAGAVVIPVGALFLLFGSWIGDQIGNHFGRGSVLHVLWIGLRWPVIVAFLVLFMAGFMYLAPSRKQRWYGVWPGATFTVGAIIGASLGLSWFLTQTVFQVKWLTYGAIGTAIVLLFWAFLGGLMILVGGEINAVVVKHVSTEKPERVVAA